MKYDTEKLTVWDLAVIEEALRKYQLRGNKRSMQDYAALCAKISKAFSGNIRVIVKDQNK